MKLKRDSGFSHIHATQSASSGYYLLSLQTIICAGMWNYIKLVHWAYLMVDHGLTGLNWQRNKAAPSECLSSFFRLLNLNRQIYCECCWDVQRGFRRVCSFYLLAGRYGLLKCIVEFTATKRMYRQWNSS